MQRRRGKKPDKKITPISVDGKPLGEWQLSWQNRGSLTSKRNSKERGTDSCHPRTTNSRGQDSHACSQVMILRPPHYALCNPAKGVIFEKYNLSGTNSGTTKRRIRQSKQGRKLCVCRGEAAGGKKE